MAAGPAKSFWSSRAMAQTVHEVKHRHNADKNFDRAQRWVVRKNIRDDGVTSNLYPIEPCNPDASVWQRYELEVTRRSTAAPTNPTRPGRPSRTLTVSPNRAWKMFGQLLAKHPQLPPLLRVHNRVYTTQVLPDKVTTLPPEYHDIGWESCRLRHVGSAAIKDLAAIEQRQALNKLVGWAIDLHAKTDGNFSVVRDHDGKIVCTEDGISVAGLRIFRGTLASVIFINDAETLHAPTPAHSKLLPATKALREVPLGQYPQQLEFLCVKLERRFIFREILVQAFLVADASGTTALTLWGYPQDTLQPGAVYSATGITGKATQPASKIGDLDVELQLFAGKSQLTMTAAAPPEEAPTDAADSGRLSLKLDTKSTVASEKSLWEEIRQHFGPGPYDESQQRRITRAVQGTPVVISFTLRHTVVRQVRFNFKRIEDIPLAPSLRSLGLSFDLDQPFAVLNDHTVVPLQVLHCCFDPRMRSWTDVTVPACSYLPSRRVGVLEQFRKALTDGFQHWGLRIANEPFKTRQVAILDEPAKVHRSAAAKPPVGLDRMQLAPLSAKPGTLVFAAVWNDKTEAADRQKCLGTAQMLARHFKSPHLLDGANESNALRFVDQLLVPDGKNVTDPDAVIVIVAPDQRTRAARWMFAECLKRGIMPIMMPGVTGEKKQRLMCDNTRINLMNKFGTDPLKGVDISKEVPVLKDRRVLIVGVDACHTYDITTGSAVGTLVTPHGNFMIPTFWRNDVRGQEVEQVTDHFASIVTRAMEMCGGLDEVVVFQDGNVFSELAAMKAKVPSGCGLTFMCLHKRSNIRFVHQGKEAANVVKGCVVQSLAPVPHSFEPVAPSFYLQSHECVMSTARTVQYTVHAVSETLPVADVQRMAYVLSHVNSTIPTKLPISTRCAHKLSSVAERLIDACPTIRGTSIPYPLCQRLWFL